MLTHSKEFLLSHKQYCLEVLPECGVLGCKPVSTPLEPGVHLHPAISPSCLIFPVMGEWLLYLTTTHQHNCFATEKLNKFLPKTTMLHFKAAHRVLRYLKGCFGRGIFFPWTSSLQLMGYLQCRLGMFGHYEICYCQVFLSRWFPHLPKIQEANNSGKVLPESEYRALACAICKLQWLSYFLNDLHIHI